MGFKVFGVLDYDGGVDNCGEGFVGEIAACLKIRGLMLIGKNGATYVCFLWRAVSEVLT